MNHSRSSPQLSSLISHKKWTIKCTVQCLNHGKFDLHQYPPESLLSGTVQAVPRYFANVMLTETNYFFLHQLVIENSLEALVIAYQKSSNKTEAGVMQV